MALSLVAFDVNGDGQLELVAGWSSGKMDVRDSQSGEVVFKDTLPAACAGLVVVHLFYSILFYLPLALLSPYYQWLYFPGGDLCCLFKVAGPTLRMRMTLGPLRTFHAINTGRSSFCLYFWSFQYYSLQFSGFSTGS